MQNVTIKTEKILQFTFHLAAGATIQVFTVQLKGDNETLLLQRNFNVSDECDLLIINPCSVREEIDWLSLSNNSNFTLTVLIWEENSFVRNIYSREFTLGIAEDIHTSVNGTQDLTTLNGNTVLILSGNMHSQ